MSYTDCTLYRIYIKALYVISHRLYCIKSSIRAVGIVYVMSHRDNAQNSLEVCIEALCDVTYVSTVAKHVLEGPSPTLAIN